MHKLKGALQQSRTILLDNRSSCAGIPVASRLLQGLPGYSLYKGAQMPFGPRSADFACAQSYTSKRICELPGNLTVSCSRLLRHDMCLVTPLPAYPSWLKVGSLSYVQPHA